MAKYREAREDEKNSNNSYGIRLPDFMFNYFVFPKKLCKNCWSKVKGMLDEFLNSLPNSFACFAFHEDCYSDHITRFLSARTSTIAIRIAQIIGGKYKSAERIDPQDSIFHMRQHWKHYHLSDMMHHSYTFCKSFSILEVVKRFLQRSKVFPSEYYGSHHLTPDNKSTVTQCLADWINILKVKGYARFANKVNVDVFNC